MIELLEKKHNKEDFNCGNDLLSNYLKNQASQDIKRKLSVCFVLSEAHAVQGYYTLSNYSISLTNFPLDIQAKLPKSYHSIPTTLLGRLAIDLKYQGKGFGKILLVDALQRSYEASKAMGSFAVVVDPVDSTAEAFYKKYDFIKLPDSGKMILSTKTLKELFE